jgi:hypothetical protein
MRSRLLLLASLAALVTRTAHAQADYRSGESGRPLRVSDAAPVETGVLVLQLAPVRVEQLSGSVTRWQVEPRLTWGALPRTEFEVRAPFVYREATASPRGGLAGVGLGFIHQFNDEHPSMPSLALGGEVVVPVGGAASTPATWVMRGLATRTFGAIRLHLNGAVGSYNSTATATSTDGSPPPGCLVNCYTALPPIIDFPCTVELSGGATANVCSASALARGPAAQAAAAPSPAPVRSNGSRLLLGLAVDHSLPLASTLLAADVFVEHLSGSPAPPDWTMECGVRYLVSRRMSFDAGIGRRFTGIAPAWITTLGVSIAWATPVPSFQRNGS